MVMFSWCITDHPRSLYIHPMGFPGWTRQAERQRAMMQQKTGEERQRRQTEQRPWRPFAPVAGRGGVDPQNGWLRSPIQWSGCDKRSELGVFRNSLCIFLIQWGAIRSYILSFPTTSEWWNMLEKWMMKGYSKYSAPISGNLHITCALSSISCGKPTNHTKTIINS